MHASTTRAAQPTLLVVDDQEENRDLLSRQLVRKGYRVLVAGDGQQALQTVASAPIDLILLDIVMPGMSGIDVLRELRLSQSEVELPVIMATARNETEDVVEALGLGANDYVTKPLDLSVVLARVQTQLRQRQRRRAQEAGRGPLSAGDLLAGRYRIDQPIGAGAFGTVYRARQLDFGQEVALKVLNNDVGGEPSALARFRREGIMACRVKHPNAVTVLDFGVSEQGLAYLVMELLVGQSLADLLKQQAPLPPGRAVQLILPVCAALAAAHQAGVIHRDIKPSNIFLHGPPPQGQVKVLDFGIAKIVGHSSCLGSLTGKGAWLGTPAYMSPERLRGETHDQRADVFSVGVTLYELLAGQLPFASRARDPLAMMILQASEPAPPLDTVVPGLPPPLQRLVQAAMHQQPEQRPTASQLGEGLAALEQ